MLAARVRQGNWSQHLNGDPHAAPSGPLWGRGRLAAQGETLAIEQNVLAAWTSWCDGLEHVGMQQERRILVLRPKGFTWQWLIHEEKRDLEVSFALDSGEFATTILREAMILRTVDGNRLDEV